MYELHKLDDKVESKNVYKNSSHQYEKQAGVPAGIKLQKSIDLRSLGHSSHHQTAAEDNPNQEQRKLSQKRFLFLKDHEQ